MKAILLSEWHRFKGAAFAVAGLQLVLLMLLHNISWLIEGISSYYYVSLVGCSLFAGVLSWYQWRSVTKKNRWAFYIHRPISRHKLFAAFACSALILFSVAFFLPSLLGLWFLDSSTGGLLDSRLSLIAPFVLGIMMCIWLAMGFTLLSPSKLSPLVFGLVVLLFNADIHGYWVFATLFIVLLWLYVVCYYVFKPALESHVKKVGPQALMAIPMQHSGFLLLLVVLTAVFQMGLIVLDKEHSGNWDTYWKKGQFKYAMRLSNDALFEYGLAQSGLQLNLKDSVVQYANIEQDWFKPRLVNQLFYMERPHNSIGKMRDKETGINWYFSHDEMLFFGIEERNGQLHGWLDGQGKIYPTLAEVSASNRFSAVPETNGKNEFYINNVAFRLNADGAKQFVSIDKSESFAGKATAMGDHYGLLSENHFYLFKPSNDRLQPLAKVPLNTPINNLVRVSMAQLGDELYISVLSGAESESNYFDAKLAFYQYQSNRQQIIHLSTVALSQAWSDLYRYRGFIVSPLMQYANEVLNNSLTPFNRPTLSNTDILTQPIPSKVVVWMLIVSLLCMGIAILLSRNSRLCKNRRIGWIVLCGICSIPGLVSFLALNHFNDKEPPD